MMQRLLFFPGEIVLIRDIQMEEGFVYQLFRHQQHEALTS